jgi:hypothetical protein
MLYNNTNSINKTPHVRAGNTSKGLTEQGRISSMSADIDSTSTPQTKQCTKCKQILPATLEYFHSDKPTSNGLHPWCKKCVLIAAAIYRAAHREKAQEYATQYRAKNREKANQYFANYRANNKEKLSLSQRQWRDSHKEHIAERQRRYDQLNPHIGKAASHRREAKKRALPNNFSAGDWKRALEFFGYCCAYCGNQQGLWNPMSADHYVPLKSSECPGTVAENMIPACHSCNCQKKASDPKVWVLRKFGKRKGQQILTRIAAYFASLEVQS